MIWYTIPVSSAVAILTLFLTAAALQVVLALEAGEWMREKRAKGNFRFLYLLLAVTSLASAAELVVAVASIEIGAFIPMTAIPRYLSLLPALLYFFTILAPVEFPASMKPVPLSFFVPLLRLPQVDLLPLPLPVLSAAFAAAWFVADSLRFMWLGRQYVKSDITLDALRGIIHNFEHGICIADRRGFVVESNPSFGSLCHRIGLLRFDRIPDLEESLKKLSGEGKLSITAAGDVRLIRMGGCAYYLRRESFKTGKKEYIQLTLSDVTLWQQKVTVLERENEHLEKENIKLESTISGIAVEASFQQREKMNRAAHDVWSHRLAVAGLSVDTCLKQQEEAASWEDVAGFCDIAVIFKEEELLPIATTLYETLHVLAAIYRRLGVEVQTGGRADFTDSEQEALCHVLREGLANAVRHAYARKIDVVFVREDRAAGMTIVNDCLDAGETVTEGRGLHDIKERIRDAGGIVAYERNKEFRLKTVFPRQYSVEVIP